jgi:hypothetical protein
MIAQLCPKCLGQGIVARPPWVPSDVHIWTSHTAGPFVCGVCKGAKVLSQHPDKRRSELDRVRQVIARNRGLHLT